MEHPWVVKYAPKSINEVIADQSLISKFSQYIEEKNIPHLLFCGKPGTGKTTCAKILAKEITSEENILYINASEQKGVDIIRNTVSTFCSRASFGGLKIVIFDEFDGMTWQAMDTMRNTMEEFIDTSRFILTCNYERKISDPIKSRCQFFDFSIKNESQHKLFIIKKCIDILTKENVNISDLTVIKKNVIKLVSDCYPDIRKTINSLQRMTVNGNFNYIQSNYSDLLTKLLEYTKQCDISSIRKEILSSSVNYNELYSYLFDNADKLSTANRLKIMLIIAEAIRWHSQVTLPEINFISCIISISSECINV